MKNYKALPLEQHLEDLSGNPSKKVEKLVSIHYIYSKPITKANFKKHLRTKGEEHFEILDELDENGNRVPTGVIFGWGVPISANPQTIGEFITIATALGRELYWEETTWVKYLYLNPKY